MKAVKIDALFQLLHDLVHDDMPYKEKAMMIKSAASSDDETNLYEFISWFEGETG